MAEYPPNAAKSPTVTADRYFYVNEDQTIGLCPTRITCPHCHQQVTTKIKFSTGTLTWILFIVLMLMGCWLGCCLIPFYVDKCQDCEHYCSNCDAYIATYKRL